ncbi:MAG: dipeptidase [Oscillochloridaceae bacterium umkhey_bin13]
MLVDGHLDLAYNAIHLGRDLVAGVAAIRAAEPTPNPGIGVATVGLPELQAGEFGLVFATLFTMPDHTIGSDLPNELVYHTPEEAHAQARAQLGYYLDWEARGLARIIRSRADLADHRATWNRGDRMLGLVLLMENADPITTPAETAWWAAQGVRMVGPAWQATRYCGGTRRPGPLTDLGRQLLPAMAEAGMILDLSHMAEESFWQALEQWHGPVIASHSNCRNLVAERMSDRHLSPAMIRAIIERDGIIGTVLFNGFLSADYRQNSPKAAYGLDLAVRHIQQICDLAGTTRHCAIGSDLDGGLGREQIPRELDTVADLPQLAEALSDAGFGDADIHGMMGHNWLRLLERALP